jgi:hypothetical protein
MKSFLKTSPAFLFGDSQPCSPPFAPDRNVPPCVGLRDGAGQAYGLGVAAAGFAGGIGLLLAVIGGLAAMSSPKHSKSSSCTR